MTIKELEQFCHELGFCGVVGDCVKDALYADLGKEKFGGPTLIYCPPEHRYVYISPRLKIGKTSDKGYIPNPWVRKKIYYYEGVHLERDESGDMTKHYTRYKLSDTDAVKNALMELKRKWKKEMNRLKVKEISKDFV